jgi:flavin-binding protein dodecin
MKELTNGQKAGLVLTSIPIVAVGGFGGWGTYTNIVSEFGRAATAAGAVAGGEGVTLIAALVMVVTTMFGQTSPVAARVVLWVAPLSASVMGLAVADDHTEQILYALTPFAMCGAAEAVGFLVRRAVVYTTEEDVDAQRRNARRAARDAARLRDLNWHQARAQHHDSERTRNRSRNAVWRLARRIATHDAELGSALAEVQRARIIEGADHALAALFGNTASGAPALPAATMQPAATDEEEPDRDASTDGPVDTPGPAEDATPRDTLPPLPTRTSAAAQQPATTVHQRITPDLEAAIEDALRTVADDTDSIRLLTVAEVARQKGVTAGTVRSWVNRGKLKPAQRDADGRLRFHPNAVAELD